MNKVTREVELAGTKVKLEEATAILAIAIQACYCLPDNVRTKILAQILLARTIIPAVPFRLFAPSEQSSVMRTEQFWVVIAVRLVVVG